MAELGVLVADDERGMRETLVDIFEASGYRVSAAPDGDAALAAMRRGGIDVVVMDIRMPGLDGVTVLREAGAPPPPVILMTAYASPEKVREARDNNVFAVVSKPFQVGHLLGLVAGATAVAA